MNDIKTMIMQYLNEVRIMQLATCAGQQPWCCTVEFAHDDAGNLYWISMPERRHSQEIAANSHVAGAMVSPQHGPGGVRGLQFEGDARQVDPAAAEELFQAYAERFSTNPWMGKAIASGVSPSRLYQLKPRRFVLYDEVNFPDQPHQEWHPN
jgi:uncharacterized protein YhbP (UPF0306 family)